MRRPGMEEILFEEECVECKQPVRFLKGTYATGFGHVYSPGGLKRFMHDGLCEWCDDILKDFIHMGNKERFL